VGAENGAKLLHPIVEPLDVLLTTRFGLFLANLSPAEVSVWQLNSRKGDGRAGGRRWWDRGRPGRLTGTLTSSLEALYVTWLRLAAFSVLGPWVLCSPQADVGPRAPPQGRAGSPSADSCTSCIWYAD
jgi:hypothetical protein